MTTLSYFSSGNLSNHESNRNTEHSLINNNQVIWFKLYEAIHSQSKSVKWIQLLTDRQCDPSLLTMLYNTLTKSSSLLYLAMSFLSVLTIIIVKIPVIVIKIIFNGNYFTSLLNFCLWLIDIKSDRNISYDFLIKKLMVFNLQIIPY